MTRFYQCHPAIPRRHQICNHHLDEARVEEYKLGQMWKNAFQLPTYSELDHIVFSHLGTSMVATGTDRTLNRGLSQMRYGTVRFGPYLVQTARYRTGSCLLCKRVADAMPPNFASVYFNQFWVFSGEKKCRRMVKYRRILIQVQIFHISTKPYFRNCGICKNREKIEIHSWTCLKLSSFPPTLIYSAIVSIPGKRGVFGQEPTAILALNVCEFILCCMKFTWCRPTEKAHSASTDVAN